MVRLISKQRKTSAGLKLTKLFDIDDFPVAKDSGSVLIIIICYLIIGSDLIGQQLFRNDVHIFFFVIVGRNIICLVRVQIKE